MAPRSHAVTGVAVAPAPSCARPILRPRDLAPARLESGPLPVRNVADIFSPGCVLYEIAVGAPPFRRGQVAIASSGREVGPPQGRPGIPGIPIPGVVPERNVYVNTAWR